MLAMDQKIESIKLFSICLSEALLKKYGKVPSATFLANQFNLRAYGTTTITRESARKWLNGLAIPEMSRLKVLIQWLEINPSDFLGEPRNENPSNQNGQAHEDGQFYENLTKLLRDLSPIDRKAIFITAWSLRELRSVNHDNLNYQKILFKRNLLKNI